MSVNKEELLFKKIFAGKASSDNTTPYFSEPTVTNARLSVFSGDVWSEAHLIPNSGIGDPTGSVVAGGNVEVGVVKYYKSISFTAIAGTPNGAGYSLGIKDWIPFNFGDGFTYNYVLTKNDGTVLNPGDDANNWTFDTEAGVLIFHDGNPSGVSAAAPPKISAYAYTGKKLNEGLNNQNITATGDISASGHISASGNLFASLSLAPTHTAPIVAVVYDSASGQFYFTGSYGGGGGGIGVGFPYSGSDSLTNDPAQAVITGSLLIGGGLKGHITASGNISASGLITANNINASNINASNISASGLITASNLYLSEGADIDGNLEVAGVITNTGFNFIEDNVTVLTGSNSFGQTSSFNQHTFTGSIIISSSQTNTFNIIGHVIGKPTTPSSVFTINKHGDVIQHGTFKRGGILSSSAQIAQDISGSWQGFTSGSGIVSSSTQIASDISGSWQGFISGSEIVSSSAQISQDISGSWQGFISGSGIISSSDQVIDIGLAGSGIISGASQLLSGNNSFGSSASLHQHTFTGSIVISSSQDNAFTIKSGSTNVFTINHEGAIVNSGILSASIATIGLAFADDFMPANAFTPDGISGSWQGYISGSGIVSNSLQFTTNSNVTFGQITASGDISSSGNLIGNSLLVNNLTSLEITSSIISASTKLIAENIFLSSSLNSNAAFKVLTIDTDETSPTYLKIFHTGSYAAGGGGGTGNLGAVGQSILPDINDSHDLGSQENKWKNLFAINTFFGGIHEVNLETEGLDKMQEGTVLSLKNGTLYPCEKEADPLVMGVVSKETNYPIVLGAEPVLVTGKVEEGDYIITSNIKGHGKGINPKHIYNQQLFGKIIAQAIEKGEGKSYIIKAMIRKM